MGKIQNEDEVLQWFKENRTYAWMTQQYLEKYGIETGLSMWGNFRRRHGLDRRQTRDSDLIPWAIEEGHRWNWDVMMLRAEARLREGKELPKKQAERLAAWKKGLEENDAVVHYDPHTGQGFFHVPRRPGIDNDLIRVPDRKTGREAAD